MHTRLMLSLRLVEPEPRPRAAVLHHCQAGYIANAYHLHLQVTAHHAWSVLA